MRRRELIRAPGSRNGIPATAEEVHATLHPHPAFERYGAPVWLRSSNGRVWEVEEGSPSYEHLVAEHAVEVDAAEAAAIARGSET